MTDYTGSEVENFKLMRFE